MGSRMLSNNVPNRHQYGDEQSYPPIAGIGIKEHRTNLHRCSEPRIPRHKSVN